MHIAILNVALPEGVGLPGRVAEDGAAVRVDVAVGHQLPPTGSEIAGITIERWLAACCRSAVS
jgi:hypothetical protein